jgi:hypothetical protein
VAQACGQLSHLADVSVVYLTAHNTISRNIDLSVYESLILCGEV